jgi:acetyl esterase/lipase
MLISGVFAAAAGAQTTQPAAPRVKLWPTTQSVVPGGDTDTDPTEPTLDIYLPPHQTAAGTGIIIFPGGAYMHLSTIREGSEVARLLVENNVAAFVLRYRHAPRYHYPIPMLDARRAIRLVRARAVEFGINPSRLGILGFSAGGHLAATVATQFDAGDPASADPIDRQSSRPDFAGLLYPVITLSDEKFVHKPSRLALLGQRTDLYAALSADQHVSPDTPPIFLACASTDTVVPAENSVMFYMACRHYRVPAELHIFAHGAHGFALAAVDPALSIWPRLFLNWLSKSGYR